MSSRARKILGLIVENTMQENKNTIEDYNLIENYNNSNKDFNDEVQNETSVSIELKNIDLESKNMITESVVDSLDKRIEASISKSHFKNSQCNKSLVPNYDSDITLSDNEDNITRYTMITEAENKNEDHCARQSSSSSSSLNSFSGSSPSSSSSSSYSDSSSPTSESDSSRTKIQTNPHSLTTRHVIIDETDDDAIIENTPPDQLSYRRNQFNNHPRKLHKVQNNYTSPMLYTDESDIDLSDTDPTYVNIESIKKKNYFFDKSSSSSTSSSNSRRATTSTLNKGQKRTKNPSQWKQNKIKRMRNKGKEYVSQSKTQKRVSARYLKEPCTDKCRLKCTTKINIEERYKLFHTFWDLGDLVKQRAYINASMVDVQSRYKYTNAERPRHNYKL